MVRLTVASLYGRMIALKLLPMIRATEQHHPMSLSPTRERLIGDAAKNQVAMNPHNTVFDAKRLIGRRFADAEVQADMKHWPFKVIDKGGKPVIACGIQG